MKRFSTRRTRSQLLLATTLAYAFGGLAGNTAHSQDGTLEEIVVTATKRSENLQDVAVTVAAFQGQELTNTGIDSQRSISMLTPNVTVNVNAAYVAPYVRGVGTQFANPGLESSVATYFNDVYVSRPSAGFMQFADIERVEVLKGPQGTLYGRNTTGGAVRVITRDPTREFEAGIAATAGNYSRFVLDGYLSGPLGDTLSGRIAAQVEQRDGWVDNLAGGPDMEDRDYTMVHAKLLWEPTDRFRAKLDFDVSDKKDFEGVTFQPLYPGAPEQVGGAFGAILATAHDEYSGNVQRDGANDHKVRFETTGAQLRFDYEFETFTFSSITGYREIEYSSPADLDASSANLFFGNRILDGTETTTQELQFVSNGEGRWDWVFGLYYLQEDGDDVFGLSGDFIGPGAMIGGDGVLDIESFAPYGQIAYNINDQWEIMVGGRYNDESKKVRNNFFTAAVNARDYPDPATITLVPTPEQEFEFSEFNPKFQLTWRPSDGQMIYLSYTEGLKSGGFNMPNPAPGPVPELDNEEIEAIELGWKLQWDTVRLNGALFQYDISALQVQVTDLASGIVTVRNAGDAEVLGLEADLTVAATNNLELGVGFGWLDAEFGSIPGGQFLPPCAEAPTDPGCVALGGLGLASVTANLDGNQLPHSPDLTAYARGSYVLPLDGNGQLSFTALVNYSDTFSYTPDNLYLEPSRTLVNLSARWVSESGRYHVGAFVNNATDEEYHTHNAPFAASGGWRVPGPPRMYGVRVGVDF